jgi:DNA polymerase-3 subunit delta'
MIARSFSAALLCENPRQEGDRIEPCGECLSCIQTAAGSNPDLITLEREKENSIGVGDIRRMRADVQIKPYSAEHKIYIIPDAEKMTPAAQNALLKTLEEPPSYAVILLLADGTGSFLPTIMSRCITLPLRPVPEKAVEDCLKERFGAKEDRARLCARFSGGSIGRAALLLESENFANLREKTILLLQKIEKTNAAQLASFAKETVTEEETRDLIDLILTWNRDLLVCRSTHSTENLIFTDEVQYIIEAAQTTSWQGLQAAAEAVFRARRRLFSNVNAELTLQMMLLEIRAAYRMTDTRAD